MERKKERNIKIKTMIKIGLRRLKTSKINKKISSNLTNYKVKKMSNSK